MKRLKHLLFIMIFVLLAGCAGPKIKLFPDQTDPLKETTLQGTGQQKILLLPIRGEISAAPDQKLLTTAPSMVQDVVAKLRKAEQDTNIRAVLLTVDSPGGRVTASDMIYHELDRYKRSSGVKMVTAMMSLAASGGYYIALPSDWIMAHPTTITGSVGVIFWRPDVTGLMAKTGLAVAANKSGENKDMGSPFRKITADENAMLQDLTDRLAKRFLDLVATHRNLDPAALDEIASARVYLAEDALRLGLVDALGYLDDAIAETKRLAGLPENAKVVAYRQTKYADDTLYNPLNSSAGSGDMSLIDLHVSGAAARMSPGFYYVWPAVFSSPTAIR